MKANKIVYSSNTGFTERYARMLAEETGLPLYRLEHAPRGGSALYLGWLCAGKIVGLSRAKKRHLITGCCAVGLSGQPDLEKLSAQLPRGKMFYLRGGYAHERLHGVYRFMMEGMLAVMRRRPKEDESAQAMLTAAREGADFVTREQLEPVANWLQE